MTGLKMISQADNSLYVDIDGVTSHKGQIQIGVPQCSILGPLLYLLYVNDIGKSWHGMILSFADDTTLITSSSNLNEPFTNANLYINNLYEWCCSNRLSLNASKTKYIVLRPKHMRYDLSRYNIHIGNTQLSRIGNDFSRNILSNIRLSGSRFKHGSESLL